MKREVYQRGIPGKKWGVWNQVKREFQFGISEDTPMLAEARLFQKIGDDARKQWDKDISDHAQGASDAVFFHGFFSCVPADGPA